VKTVLNAPETRKALLAYLASDDPWVTTTPGFAMNTLTFVLSGATADEARFVRPLVLHPVPDVRVRAYTFLVAVAGQDRTSLIALLETMMMDPDDMVRTAGARYIEQTDALTSLRLFLERWVKLAPARGWNGESRELIDRLLKR
jgi:hypothetical protein